MAPSSNDIVDSSGNVWTLSGGQIYENGVVWGGSANVIMLLYYNNVIYQQNAACGVWQYAGVAWTQTVLPFSGLPYSQQPTYNTDPVIPSSVLNICPGIGGIWGEMAGQGSTNWVISTDAGEFLFLNENNSEICCGITYVNLANNNDVLTGSGYFGESYVAEVTSSSGGKYSTGAAAPYTIGSGSNPALAISPRISISNEWFYNVAYETPPSLAAIAGTYTLQFGGALFIAADGTLGFQDTANTGCTFTGSVSILDPFHSVYRLNVTATGCTGPTSWNGVPEQGIIAFPTIAGSGGGQVIGGTSFTDSNGVPAINVFLAY